MSKLKNLNKYQKAAKRPGEERVSCDDVAELLRLSESSKAEDRRFAAGLLCPCHVRRRIDAVWAALYRMLEDPDVQVRLAAWHTLEDGGRPDDPALDEIITRALQSEKNAQVLGFVKRVAGPRQDKELAMMRRSTAPVRKQRGKCDFCGQTNVPIDRDLETMIPDGREQRAAWVCETCAK
jgi:hypothetical protein